MDYCQSYGALSYLRNYSTNSSIRRHDTKLSELNKILQLFDINSVQKSITKLKHSASSQKTSFKGHNNELRRKHKLTKQRSNINNSSNNNYYNNCHYHNSNCNCGVNKMAPISEKRSPTIKENTKENVLHNKNTVQQQQQHGGRISSGPEILDFRESWLQEIEMYKDHVKNQQSSLTTHNHLHTIDGCLTVVSSPPLISSMLPKEINQPPSSIQVIKTNEVKRRARTKNETDCDPAKMKISTADPDDVNQQKSQHQNNLSNGVGTETVKTSVTKNNQDQLKNTSKNTNNSTQNHNITSAVTGSVSYIPGNSDNVNSSSIDSPKPKSIRNRKSPSRNLKSNKNNSSYKHPENIHKSININSKNAVDETLLSNLIPPTYNTSLDNVIRTINSKTSNDALTPTQSNDEVKNIENNEKLVENSDSVGQIVSPAKSVEPNAKNRDDDNESFYDDDEIIGTIDVPDDNTYSSDDSEDEYVGCPFYLNPEEENLNRAIEKQTPIKLFQKVEPTGVSICALLNEPQREESGADDSIDVSESNLSQIPELSPKLGPSVSEYYTPKSILTPSLFPLVPPYLTFSSHNEKGPPVPPELQRILKWRLSAVMPKVVRRVVANSGFRLIKKTNDWMASWEKHMKSPCFRLIKSHQKFNHLPGTFKIGRKDSVWRNIKLFMSKYGRKEFGFMQKSFVLPQDLNALKKAWPKHAQKGTKWIIKPPASARGSGIKVVSRWTEFPKQKPLIVQRYIEKPLLINGNKFDLRLYVIITSINPLRIFMHTDGLARFAAVQYSDDIVSLKDRCMHLTNYSINKFSSHYHKNEDHNACQGHKWTLKSLWNYFQQRGINTTKLWGALRNLVIKTVIGGEGCLNRMYKANVNSRYNCYELFGFDVLLDENLVPWLLEVNISPSLHSDLPLDQHVKGPLIQAVLNGALYQIPPKLTSQHEQIIKTKYNITGPLCFDKRIYTTHLTQEEVRKHNYFTSRNIEYREEYLDSILDELTPDDVRCLILTEDELTRSKPLERIFPSIKSFEFLRFLEGPRYYNRLLDAWETKYHGNKKEGIKLLSKLCAKGYHLKVPDTAMTAPEPPYDVDIFELNALYRAQAKAANTPTVNTTTNVATKTSNTAEAGGNDIKTPTHADVTV